jgi:hypothetical protein
MRMREERGEKKGKRGGGKEGKEKNTRQHTFLYYCQKSSSVHRSIFPGGPPLVSPVSKDEPSTFLTDTLRQSLISSQEDKSQTFCQERKGKSEEREEGEREEES